MSQTQHFTSSVPPFFFGNSGTPKLDVTELDDTVANDDSLVGVKWTTLSGYNKDSTGSVTPESIAKSRELAYKLYYNLESVSVEVEAKDTYGDGESSALPSNLILRIRENSDSDFPTGAVYEPYIRVAKSPSTTYDASGVAVYTYSTVSLKVYRLYDGPTDNEDNFLGFGCELLDAYAGTSYFSYTSLWLGFSGFDGRNDASQGDFQREEALYTSLSDGTDDYHFAQTGVAMNVADDDFWTTVIEELSVSQSVLGTDSTLVSVSALNFYTY